VHDVSLQVARGEVVGLLGPNGAGKTTVIKMLLGLVTPDAGEVLLLGRPVDDPAARAGVGYLPELFRYQPWLSAAEVLALHVRLSGADVSAAEQRDRLDLVGLGARAADRVGGFSKGMQQRLGLAVALVARPRFVVLDEPTSALDPLGRADVRDVVLGLREQGVAVLLNSHLIGEVERVCDRVVVLERGRVAAAGSLAELLGQRQVRLRLTGRRPRRPHALPGRDRRRRRRPRGARAGARPRGARRGRARRRARPREPGGPPARHPARGRRRARGAGAGAAAARGGGAVSHQLRVVVVVALLTLREASRRRVVLALVGLTALLLALSGWGFWRLAQELTSGEALVASSQVLNLVMFGLSLVAALGTAFLSGPTLSGETESGAVLSVLARPVRRWAWLAGKWLGLVVFGGVYVVVAGFALCLVVLATVGYWPPDPLAGLLLLAGQTAVLLTLSVLLATVVSPMASGVVSVGLFGAAWIAGVVGGVGSALGNEGVARVGTVSRVVLPTDGLWRGAMHAFQDPSALVAMGPSAEAFPFLSVSSPTPAYLVWAVVWVVMVFGLAAVVVARKDL
jgi:ABC-type multidrug transport system ATPase subunit/ABC-type transport system involved in multi-copper enzyme maturation permease subunit